MHLFLQDPENAKAYQTLIDYPRGSTRAWAARAGWTHSRMVRFLDALKRAGIAEVVKPEFGRGSLFRTVPKRSETFRAPDLGSKSESDKVPRYGEAPAKETAVADPDEVRIIAMLNSALSTKFPGFSIAYDNRGSITAAKKILKIVPVDRAVALIWEAGMAFTPDRTGGDLPRSLGHPFFVKYVINEYRRSQRDLERGQLSMVFVERVEQRPVYGARRRDVEELPPAKPETIAAGVEEFRALANSPHKPRRL